MINGGILAATLSSCWAAVVSALAPGAAAGAAGRPLPAGSLPGLPGDGPVPLSGAYLGDR